MFATESRVDVSLGDLRKLQRRRLTLPVLNGQMDWEYHESEKLPVRRPRQAVRIEVDPDERRLIEMLAHVQRLLSELRPEERMQRDTVNAVLYRIVAELGDRMFRILFADPDLLGWLQSGQKAAASADGNNLLRIELEFSGSSAYLATWPWEYLYRRRDDGQDSYAGAPKGDFLSLSTNLILNRRLRDQLEGDFARRKPSMVLFVSRPRDEGPVECDDVISAVTRLDEQGVVTLNKVVEPPDERYFANQPVASWEAFRHAIATARPQVIHFIGHGRLTYDQAMGCKVGQLAFVGKDGRADWRNETQIAEAVNVQRNDLRLVFLQACETAKADPRESGCGVARNLALSDVPAVIAMQSKVQNAVATKFACTFYECLKARLPLDWSVMKARQAIRELPDLGDTERTLSFGVPVVYLGSYPGGLIDPDPPDNVIGPTRPTTGSTDAKNLAADILKACPYCDEEVPLSSVFCWKCSLQLLCRNEEKREKPCRPLFNPSFDGGFCSDCAHPFPKRPRPPDIVRKARDTSQDTDGTFEGRTLLRDRKKEASPAGVTTHPRNLVQKDEDGDDS